MRIYPIPSLFLRLRSVLHNSMSSLLFKFAIRLKWPENTLNSAIISFLQFAILEKISESCDVTLNWTILLSKKIRRLCCRDSRFEKQKRQVGSMMKNEYKTVLMYVGRHSECFVAKLATNFIFATKWVATKGFIAKCCWMLTTRMATEILGRHFLL